MSKYDYDAIGFHRSYESYVKAMEEHPYEGMVIPTKEAYESKLDADFERTIKIHKARYMISSLKNKRSSILSFFYLILFIIS